MRRFKHLSNKELVKVINDRYVRGLRDQFLKETMMMIMYKNYL